MRDATVETCEFEAQSGLTTRRKILTAGLGLGAAALAGTPALAAPRVVPMPGNYPQGTIIISLRQRRLFFTTGEGQAISYPVAVGMSGRAWAGWARVDGKHVNPAWMPPAVVRMRASIGTAASYGCIRMLNEDVADLYDRVSVGSPVVMQP